MEAAPPEEYRTVPLVVYVDGERKVIGEATIQGSVINAVVGEDAGAVVMKYLDLDLADFSIGQFPFRIPRQQSRSSIKWRVKEPS